MTDRLLLLPHLFLLLLAGLSAATFLSPRAHAQDAGGAITGVIVDAETGETLIGANVVLPDTQATAGGIIGATTDLNGRFEIDGLAPGTYDVQLSYVGYQAKTVTGVEVQVGEATTLEVTLTPATAELEAVTVTAAAALNSEAGLLQRRQKAAALSNAISAEAISASGSSTAAGAVKKVTGVSVIGGKYVHVRGLGGRYVNTQLNGAELPSADPNSNSVPFDLFSASLLENIVTRKTFTPDMSGSFTGGNILINTKSFPPELNLTLSSSIAYNSEVGFGNDLPRVLGVAEELPGVLAEGAIPNLTEARNDQAAAEQLNAASRALGAVMVPLMRTAPVEQSYGLSFGNEFELFGGRPLGVIANLSYDRSISGYDGGQTAQWSLPGDVAASQGLGPELLLQERSGTYETLLGGLVNLSFRPHPRHEVGVNVLYNRSEQDVARDQAGRIPRDIGDPEVVYQTRTLHHIERLLLSLQGRGEHVFGSGLLGSNEGVRVSWNTSLAQSTQKEPDYRLFANHYKPNGDDTTYVIAPSIYPLPTRYFRDLEEGTWSNDLSVAVPVASASVKVGGSYVQKDLRFRQRTFKFQQDFVDYEGDPQAFFGRKAGLIEQNDAGRYLFGNYIVDRTSPADNFDGEQTIGAGFAMVDLLVPGLTALRLVGGVRVEYTHQTVANQEEDPERGEIEQTDLLPSANLIYAITDEMNARLAYGRTLARPTFLEFAPFCSYAFIGGHLECGNVHLSRTRVHNFDARWEWFTRPGEIVAVSAFYKNFQQPIERVFNPVAAGDNQLITYENVEDATVYGVEFEVRKRLDFIAEPLRYLNAGANLTLVRSTVSIPPNELALIRSYNPDADDTRDLQGQSPYVVNASLAYDNPASGTSVGLFYNVFGPRLHVVANGPDLYEQPRHTLDLILSQQVGFGLEVKASAKNLLGAEYEVVQTFKGQEFINDRYPLGRSFSLGLTYNL